MLNSYKVVPIWLRRYDGLSVVATQRTSDLLAVQEHLISRHLHPVQVRLAPLYHKVGAVTSLEPYLRGIGGTRNDDLEVLNVGRWRGIVGVFGLHENIIDCSKNRNDIINKEKGRK